MAAIGDLAGAARDTVGRYFSLVSALPAAVLVVYVFVLVASGAWAHPPDFSRAFQVLAHLSVGGLVILAIASLAAALVLHPLQVAMVQILEGYWGSGPAAVFLRGLATAWYVRRQGKLISRFDEAIAATNSPERRDQLDDHPVRYYRLLAQKSEAARLLAERPDANELMPTKLGNMLRFYERAAGAPFGLEVIGAAPYLASVAASKDMDYVNDQRSNMDLAVRMSLTSALAALLWAAFFWRHGPWLLVGLFPVLLSYLSYRGAVLAAAEYGRALCMLVALNRFALYERLHLEPPTNRRTEARTIRHVRKIVEHEPVGTITYVHNPAKPTEPA